MCKNQGKSNFGGDKKKETNIERVKDSKQFLVFFVFLFLFYATQSCILTCFFYECNSIS